MHTGERQKERAKRKFREEGSGEQRKMDVKKEREGEEGKSKRGQWREN